MWWWSAFFPLSQNHKLTFWKYTCWLPKKGGEKSLRALWDDRRQVCVRPGRGGKCLGTNQSEDGIQGRAQRLPATWTKEQGSGARKQGHTPHLLYSKILYKKIMHFLLWTVACFCYWNTCKPLKKQKGKHSPTLVSKIWGIGTFCLIRIKLNKNLNSTVSVFGYFKFHTSVLKTQPWVYCEGSKYDVSSKPPLALILYSHHVHFFLPLCLAAAAKPTKPLSRKDCFWTAAQLSDSYSSTGSSLVLQDARWKFHPDPTRLWIYLSNGLRCNDGMN